MVVNSRAENGSKDFYKTIQDGYIKLKGKGVF